MNVFDAFDVVWWNGVLKWLELVLLFTEKLKLVVCLDNVTVLNFN